MPRSIPADHDDNDGCDVRCVPAAIGMGIGSELRKPLGVPIVGGLIVSQILTLYTTPVIYLALDQLRQRKRKPVSGAMELRPIGWPPLSGSQVR